MYRTSKFPGILDGTAININSYIGWNNSLRGILHNYLYHQVPVLEVNHHVYIIGLDN